ncbi:MAG TPA: molybdopterin-dependent oxidoreductase [Pseudonocardia sp.]|nr:molybdopterin-dependent oxidoreductase [Pseudonocardia sp.]
MNRDTVDGERLPVNVTTPVVTGLSRLVAATIGVLAAWLALGVGHLAAGLFAAGSSPYLAVGDAVVRLSPQALTEFAKTTFGTWDKPVLLLGMFVVITLVAAAGGLASRWRREPGMVVIGAMGVLGGLAVVSGPVFTQADLLAPLAALVAGVGAFALLHGLGLRTVEGTDPSRRTVLLAGGAAVGLGALASATGGVLLTRSLGAARADVTALLGRAKYVERATPAPAGAAFPQLGTPTFLTANSDFYRIDTALRVPTLSASDWRLRVHGMVGRELTLRFEDLVSRPLVERTITMTCVSNPIGGNLVSTANFVGVPLRDVLLEAGVAPGADQLFSTSSDGWYTGTPMATVLEADRGALLAIGMNGEALPYEHGFPVRMVVPGLYGYVSGTKWLVDLEATTFADPAKQGYWLQRGWSQRGPIKTMARIDSPAPFGNVTADTVTVAGIAWAQHTGVAKVEIRVDGGPWRATTLSDEVSLDTWRMWHTELALPPGSHSIEARATDKGGYTQTDQRADPIPDGATGWPSVRFTVT